MTKLLMLLTLMLGCQFVAAGTLFLEDFSGFAGTGLQPGGGNGALDSNQWRISGLSGGDTRFGDQLNHGNIARGRSPGKVRSSGLYAFSIGGGQALGWQSTGADLTPGSLLLRIQNNTQSIWRDLWLNFELWFYNDQPRSNSVSLRAGTSTIPWLRLTNFSTPLVAAVNPAWRRRTFNTALQNLVVPGGGLLFLEWQLDDAGGRGSRDELAIDHLRLTSLDPAQHVGDGNATILYCGFGLILLQLFRLRPTIVSKM